MKIEQGCPKKLKSKAFRLHSSSSNPVLLSSSLACWGLTLIIAGIAIFVSFIYATVISKLLPASGIPVLFAIQNDRYYSLLVPLTIPILVVFVYFHWLSMKLFKHAPSARKNIQDMNVGASFIRR